MAARSNAESDSDPRTDDGIEAVPQEPGGRLMRVSDPPDFVNSAYRSACSILSVDVAVDHHRNTD
jgi:hypothetical protein